MTLSIAIGLERNCSEAELQFELGGNEISDGNMTALVGYAAKILPAGPTVSQMTSPQTFKQRFAAIDESGHIAFTELTAWPQPRASRKRCRCWPDFVNRPAANLWAGPTVSHASAPKTLQERSAANDESSHIAFLLN